MVNTYSMEDLGCLPHGAHLFRKRNDAGGWTYYSDEISGGIEVWDTCIVNESTLLAAILSEKHRSYMEFMHNKGWRPTNNMQREEMAAIGGSFLAPIENGSVDGFLPEASGQAPTLNSTSEVIPSSGSHESDV